MQLCAQRRQLIGNIIPMAAPHVLVGELTKLISRPLPFQATACCSLCIQTSLVSYFGPTLTTFPNSLWELWQKVCGTHSPEPVSAENAPEVLQWVHRAIQAAEDV